MFRDGYKKFTRVSRDSLMNGGGGGLLFRWSYGAPHMHEHCNYLDSHFASHSCSCIAPLSAPNFDEDRGKLPL